jgi:hypothetical protein
MQDFNVYLTGIRYLNSGGGTQILTTYGILFIYILVIY